MGSACFLLQLEIFESDKIDDFVNTERCFNGSEEQMDEEDVVCICIGI